MLRFSPSEKDKKSLIKSRINKEPTVNYNFHNRVNCKKFLKPLNKQVLFKANSRMHHLACHSPDTIQQKWKRAYSVFDTAHFGKGRLASPRYLNKWSCHSWL